MNLKVSQNYFDMKVAEEMVADLVETTDESSLDAIYDTYLSPILIDVLQAA